jgi:hypothetical protein
MANRFLLSAAKLFGIRISAMRERAECRITPRHPLIEEATTSHHFHHQQGGGAAKIHHIDRIRVQELGDVIGSRQRDPVDRFLE